MAMRLSMRRQLLRFKTPLPTAFGELSEREIVTVQLTGQDGISGFGEAAPLAPYDGIGIERTLEALERHSQVFAELDDGALPTNLLDACRNADPLPQALSAIDLALWDRAGRRERKPVCALLVDNPADAVPVNATLAALDRAGAAREAAKAVAGGFRCLKVKVGIGDDAGRVAAVRAAAGQEVSLRLDANGAWNVEQAVSTINALSATGLELVEEPTHGLAQVRQVRDQVPVRIAIDETAAEPGALASGAADAVCLKLSRCGGISGLLAAASLVRASGAEVYIASTFDGPLGVAGALHAAAALASRGPLAPCGLATLSLFEGLEDRLPAHGGEVRVPTGPGLGVEPL
ncbi:MAG TPA: mandelate racemase/muconate lactonizing enzyme family protein [Solirubrobacteraceae bacterium]|jgi:L-alanine-DL-glutamate epimerase-like enolase superfamily enzyme